MKIIHESRTTNHEPQLKWYVSALLIMALVLPVFSAKKFKGDDIGNLVVEGENRLKLKSGMPPLEWNVNPYRDLGEEFAFMRVYEELSPPQIAKPPVVIPESYDSKKVATPWLTRIMPTPVLTLTFKTDEKIEGAMWIFVVKDSAGKTFYEERDKGYVPEKLVWDGRGSNGEMMAVGYDYTYVFTVIDAAGNAVRKAGQAFRLDAMRYREDGWLVMAFDPHGLFVDETRPDLSQNGRLYMEEVKDRVAEHFNGAVHIRIYARDPNLAKSRADIIQKYLMDILTLSPDQFKVVLADPFKGGGGYDHVDIAVK